MSTFTRRTSQISVFLATLLITLWQGYAQDSWQAISSVGSPSPRLFTHTDTSIWTGTEMLIWGGEPNDINGTLPFGDGARYNPATDTWTMMSATGAPTGRENFTAVWTGREMIIWGGQVGPGNSNSVNDGARYNPLLDTWTTISTVGAPSPRQEASAVWTGTEMIVWGGISWDGSQSYFDGARYNPVTDSWTPMNTQGRPSGVAQFAVVWTGTEMIVWGGASGDEVVGDGARYNPVTDSWTAMSSVNAPSARQDHITAVWATNTEEVIIWGGGGPLSNTGGRYSPSSDTWIATSTTGAPSPRGYNSGIWTGSELIIWGGEDEGIVLNDGARYNPVTDSWTPMTSTDAPSPRHSQASVWTGERMIIWGGTEVPGGGGPAINDGASYFPVLTPLQQLTNLVSLVSTFNLRQGIENSLDAKLLSAEAALGAAQSGSVSSTCGMLGAFINEVQAQSGNKIMADQATELEDAARKIETAIGCP